MGAALPFYYWAFSIQPFMQFLMFASIFEQFEVAMPQMTVFCSTAAMVVSWMPVPYELSLMVPAILGLVVAPHYNTALVRSYTAGQYTLGGRRVPLVVRPIVSMLYSYGFGRKTVGLFVPSFVVLAATIWLLNNFGLTPFAFTATSLLATALACSGVVFFGAVLVRAHSVGWQFFSLFVPAGCPTVLVPLLVIIEFVSYLVRFFSLGIRLFANMLAGHAILGLVAGTAVSLWEGCIYNKAVAFSEQVVTAPAQAAVSAVALLVLALTMVLPLMVLESVVASLQAYVFFSLSALYISESTRVH